MRTGLALVLALLLPAVASAKPAKPTPVPEGDVSVIVTLAGDTAKLPADAVLDATLEDVSRADAAATVLGNAHAPWPGDALHLTIGYDPKAINPAGRYAVRARLSSGTQLLYISDTQHAVLTHGASNAVALQLVSVAPSAPAAAAPAGDSALLGTLWVLTSIKGKPAPVNVTPRAAHLQLDGNQQQASGSGGCNRYSGGYTLSGNKLRFGALAATKMACLNASGGLEPTYFKALSETRRWRIHGSELELIDGGGQTVLRFRGATVLR